MQEQNEKNLFCRRFSVKSPVPPYTAGLYTEGDTTMVLSRGLGNSAFPFRIFNRPEIVCVQLSAD